MGARVRLVVRIMTGVSIRTGTAQSQAGAARAGRVVAPSAARARKGKSPARAEPEVIPGHDALELNTAQIEQTQAVVQRDGREVGEMVTGEVIRVCAQLDIERVLVQGPVT